MFQKFFNASKWFLLPAAIFIGGAVSASFVKHPFEKIGDLATWVGALGTFLAFIGTITLANSESRRRSQEAMKLAQLTAIRFSAITMESIIKCTAVHDQLNANMGTLKNYENLKTYEILLKECPVWTLEELIPLIVLPNSCAASLASARQGIDIIANLFGAHNSTSFAPPGKGPADFYVEAAGSLSFTIKNLKNAARDCELVVAGLN